MTTAQILTNARISASIVASIAKSTDFQDLKQNFKREISEALTSGTGTGAVDVLWADSRTLSPDQIETLDLAGVLADFFSDTVEFVDIKAILIANTSTTAATISWIASVANGWHGVGLPFNAASEKRNILKGCFEMIGNPGAGWAVTAGSADSITFEEESTLEATYDIIIIGATA